jgi:ABC-type phosphate transport system substrate-binding protein
MTRKHLACSIFAAALSFSAAHAATTTLNTGGSSLAAPTYIAEYKLYTSSNPTILFNYEAVGSGAGQKAFLNNDITQFENVPAGTLTYGTIVGTQVDIGASDAYLSASQLTNPATGSYANSALDGPVIQIPTFGTPIALAYNESGETGTLGLKDAQVCGILSGKINDWHTLVSTIPAGTAIKVTVRSDSSGTTFLLTQHLNVVCNSSNSSFPSYPVPVTKYFYNSSSSASNYVFNTLPANFVGESGSANVASNLVATANSIGYISPDYTSIAPMSANTTSLKVASLYNATNGVAYSPNVTNTETGLANPGAGSTNPTPPSTLAAAMNPLNWVPAIPVTTSGYPIVGYTTMLVSSCYASKTAASAINAFLVAQYGTTAYVTIIKNNGFAPLINTKASPFYTAVYNDFLSNKNGYNLNIENATTCASYKGR